MARNGSGTYSLPQADVVTGTAISSTVYNSDLNDIAAALTQSVSKDGQTSMTGTLNMGSNPITGVTTMTTTGAITATAFIPSGSTVPTNGMYLSAANTVAIASNSLKKWTLVDSANATVEITDTNAAATTNYRRFDVNAVTKAYVGISAAGNIITGGVAGDLCLRCENGVIRFGNAATQMGLLSAGALTITAGLSATTLTGSSTATATAFIPTGSTVPANGMYLSTTNTLAWATATTARLTLNATGNFTVNAPSSGVTFTINNAASAQSLVCNGGASTPVFAIGNSSTAFTMDCSQSNVFTVTMTGNVAAGLLTISNIADGQTVVLRCTQDGTGSRTLGNPTSVKWPGGVPSPILSTAASAVDIITFTRISGVTYAAVQNAFA